MTVRKGSIQDAAAALGITPAAVGQRIRALETYLETDLLVRGRSGIHPAPTLATAMQDLEAAFDALDRVASTLELQRTAEVHIVADPDLSELWLVPNLPRFKAAHPNVLLNLNGLGDVPMRLGAPDIVIDRNPNGRAAEGEELFREIFLPIASPENAERIRNPDFRGVDQPDYLPTGTLTDQERFWRHSVEGSIEGFPLIHTHPNPEQPGTPGWSEWLAEYGYERTAPERGPRYAHVRDALEGARSNVGLLISGLSYILNDIDAGVLALPFPPPECLRAEHPYRIAVRSEALARPQVARFRDWIIDETRGISDRLDAAVAE